MIESYAGPKTGETGCFVTKRNMTGKDGFGANYKKDMNGTGIIIKQYTAKELNVSIGERVIGLEELNGWVWCEGRDGEKGWVPKENLQKY